MGVYDIYGDVQLKVSENVCCKYHEIGDKVNISDGIYVGYEGVVVVVDGTFVAQFHEIRDKWGGILSTYRR